MNNKILIIIGVIIVLGVGLCGGYYFEKTRIEPQLIKTSNTLKTLGSSKVIYLIVANGKVSKISDRVITISSGTDSLDLKVREDVVISTLAYPLGEKLSIISSSDKLPAFPMQSTKFEDIKVGDNVSVSLTPLSDGQFEIKKIVIIPQAFSTQK